MMQPPPALGGRPGSRGRIDKKDLEQLREAFRILGSAWGAARLDTLPHLGLMRFR